MSSEQYRATFKLNNSLSASSSWDSVRIPQLTEGLSREVSRKFKEWEVRRYGRASGGFNDMKTKKK